MKYSDRAVIRLRELSEQYGSGILEELNRHSSGESFILKHLVLRNCPIHPSELQICSGRTSARITAILNNLEKKGLIERTTDPNDRRKVLIFITDNGHHYAEEEIDRMHEHMKSVFEKLGRKDTQELMRILEKLAIIFTEERRQNK